MTQPALILVNGLSGTGKSGLAAKLAGDLGLPYFGNDQLKEVIFDTLGWDDLEWSKKLGPVSSALLWSVCQNMLAAGQSLLIESVFHIEADSACLRSVQEQFQPRIAEIHCHAPRELLAERVKERAESGDRHPGHGDQDDEALHEEVIPDLLEDPDPLLEAPDLYILVNTEEFSDEQYEELKDKVQTFMAAA